MNHPIFFRSTRRLMFSFFFLVIMACQSTNYLSKVEIDRVEIGDDAALTENAAITTLIQPFKNQLDTQMEEVIGGCAATLIKERPESGLGNWMADAIHRQTELYTGKPIDFAVQNYGGIRIPELSKGLIKRGKIYELMPFDNQIVVLSLNGEEVEELIRHIVKGKGWPVSYGIKITQTTETDLSIVIKGAPLDDKKTYQVALPDYIANGGSGSHFLLDKQRQTIDRLIREALIEDVINHTKNNQEINGRIEGRLVLINELK